MKVAQILYSGLGGHGSVAFSLIDADKDSEWKPKMGFVGVEPLSIHILRNARKRTLAMNTYLLRRANLGKVGAMCSDG